MDTEPLEAQATQPTEPLEARRIRLAKNQSLFRAVNDRIDYMARAQSAVLPLRVLCECADPGCDAHVELTQGEYEAVRQNPTQFFVLPAHVFPELETIVETARPLRHRGEARVAAAITEAIDEARSSTADVLQNITASPNREDQPRGAASSGSTGSYPTAES